MPALLKNILAVVAGIVLGSIVNMAIITIGPSLIPLPEGVDMSDMDRFAENLRRLEPVHFVAPWLAHALGTLVGAFVAARLAASHQLILALGIGLFFLLGGITMAAAYGGPLWFVLLDLLAAYVPMGYLGGAMAGARRGRGIDTQPNSS